MERWTATGWRGRTASSSHGFWRTRDSRSEAEVRAAAEGRQYRVLRPSWMRMDDLVPERLNFQLAEDGSLVELWPG